MDILDFAVPANYELILFGDNQEGNILSYKKGYQQAIQYILDAKNRFALHMGDEMEAFWISDPRYDPAILQTDPLSQQKTVVKDLAPLAKAKRLITILRGNHTDKLYPMIGDITKNTCEDKLHIPYGGWSCVVKLNDKNGLQFKGYFTHGRKLIRSVADDPIRNLANLQLQLKQHLKYKFGDALLMAKAHTHRLIVSDPRSQLYLTTEPGEGIKEKYTHFRTTGYIHPDHRWYCNTGSFLKTFGENVTSYSEKYEYDPVELGYIVVEVRDRLIINVRKVVV